MPGKVGRVYVLGSAASSPHIMDGINESEFEFFALDYDKTTTDEELAPHLEGLAKADFLCAGGDACVDERLLAACPNIKIVSVNGVGYDGTDVPAVTRAGVWLANAPVLREACADLATLLMLAVMRKAAAGYRLCLSAGPPQGWDWGVMREIVGDDPRGKTLGLIGFGRIGQTFAQKVCALRPHPHAQRICSARRCRCFRGARLNRPCRSASFRVCRCSLGRLAGRPDHSSVALHDPATPRAAPRRQSRPSG
eukprot:SAG22_NODE_83_length_21704_cov_58.556584_11_plen_252_part_00